MSLRAQEMLSHGSGPRAGAPTRSPFARDLARGLVRSLVLISLVSVLALLVPGLAQAQSDPANPANPFDPVGLWHNQALDQAIAITAELGENPAVVTLASSEILGEFRDAVFGADHVSPPIEEEALARHFHDPASSITEAESHFDDTQRLYYGQLLARVDELRPGMSADEVAEWLDGMRALETSMLADLGEERGQVLLAAAAVGRYSHAYWNHQLALGKASAWPGFGNGSDIEARIPSHIASDIQGAIVGGLVGAGGGPLGSLGGALEGAALGSLAALIWDWLF